MDVLKWFSELDWGGFVPDLIVGLATGVVVGLVLVGFERRLIDLRRKSEDEQQWGERLERIHGALLEPLPFTEASYRPFGDIVERVERMSQGAQSIHPKVTVNFPELAMLGPLLEKLDALPIAADRLERATEHMLRNPMFTKDEPHYVIDVVDVVPETVRSVVRFVNSEDPHAELISGPEWLQNLDLRMAMHADFREASVHYRSLLIQIEAFRSAFIDYRNARRAEVMRKNWESVRSARYRHPSNRQVHREYAASLRAVEPILKAELERAHSTVPGD